MKELFEKTQTGDWKTAGVDTQYRIEETNDTVYLIFQGSSSQLDWLANFSFFVKPYKDMKQLWFAHGGFVNRWKEAQNQITYEILTTLHGRKLVIIGYSHGAALAILAHEWFWFNYHDPTTFAFASPRVLWMTTLKKRFEKLTIIRNRGDLVTHVPFWIMGFRHVGKLLLIGAVYRLILPKWHYPEEYKKSLANQ